MRCFEHDAWTRCVLDIISHTAFLWCARWTPGLGCPQRVQQRAATVCSSCSDKPPVTWSRACVYEWHLTKCLSITNNPSSSTTHPGHSVWLRPCYSAWYVSSPFSTHTTPSILHAAHLGYVDTKFTDVSRVTSCEDKI